MCIEGKTLGEKCKARYRLRRDRNPKTRINAAAKLLFQQKNYILKAYRITTTGTGVTKENIRLQIRNDKSIKREKEVDNKRVMNDTERSEDRKRK
jgi:hypothetical protein